MTIERAIELAIEHHQAGRLGEAEQIYRQILAREPGHADAMHLLGVLAAQCGQFDAAIEFITRAIAINPSMAAAHKNLGNSYRAKGQLDEALAAYREALRLHQGEKASAGREETVAEIYDLIGCIQSEVGLQAEALESFNFALAHRPDDARAHSNRVAELHYHPEFTPQMILAEHRLWNERHALPLARYIRAHTNNRDANRRLRIGYVSPDLHEHPVARFLLPLFESHNRDQFEIICYSNASWTDGVTERLRSLVGDWRDISTVTDEAAAELIRADKVDILVDLAMHTMQNRLLVFARKPAPVQVTYLAYCSTTGLDAIDYRFTDASLDPPGGDEGVYSERSVRLPSYWCYVPDASAPQVVPPPVLEGKGVTFGCLNNFAKVTPAALGVWSELLKTVSSSRLIISASPGSHRDRVRN